ncbi:DUF4175 domain-containing protein [Henriciella aquimarina]|uniref:DUF4175 domain-containing protein n=1 Tax=Henriciella aquimarina TaxID=545261 RepID=UPI000A031690|nr:DUF4175 family protein [Henriciella aquimarina]
MADLKRIPGIEPKIARTRGALWRLAAARAFWPSFVLVALFALFAVTGMLDAASEKLASLSLIIFVGGLAIVGVLGWARFRPPDRTKAVKRLDRQSDLRPLATLGDRPAHPEADGVALWRAHETRLTDAARRLNIPSLSADWKKLDPFYLRYALPALLIAAFVVAWPAGGDRLQRAFAPDIGSLFGAESIRIEAWITPPSHTGRPPIFLQDAQDGVRVPAGSEVTVRAQAPSAPHLVIDGTDSRSKARFSVTPEGAYEATGTITEDSEIRVTWWGKRAAWTILASPDEAPAVEWVSEPELLPNDKTEFGWKVSDDYGVDSLEMVFTLTTKEGETKEDAVAVQLPAISPKEAEETTAIDLTRHRWAGLEVEARLRATDGAGQAGLSEPVTFTIPEKLLLQPLARAIQDIRVTILREDGAYEDLPDNAEALQDGAVYTAATQRIAHAPPGIQRAGRMIEGVTFEAPRYFEDISIYMGLRHVAGVLQAASSTDEADTTEPLLWSLALRAEYGSAADALRALQAARKALEEALRDGASEAEIKRRLEAFKEAAQNYLAARMAEAMANGLDAPPNDTDSAQNGGGQSLGGSDFSDMLDALGDLTETGATDQARQLLSDITNMLENLQFQQGNNSGDGFPGMPGQQQGENDEDVPQEERELSETLQNLSDLLREQRELNDDTMAEQRGEGQQPNGQQSGAEGNRGNNSLADRQDELGDGLRNLGERGRDGSAGSEDEDGEEGAGGGGEEMDEETLQAIERAQRRAAEALRDGNGLRAQRNQEEATDRLRDLAQGLAGQLDELRKERLGDEYGSEDTDPFGRPMGGVADGRDVNIPDEAERQRAKDILDELRRRYGTTPDEEERDYLERLLDRF